MEGGKDTEKEKKGGRKEIGEKKKKKKRRKKFPFQELNLWPSAGSEAKTVNRII